MAMFVPNVPPSRIYRAETGEASVSEAGAGARRTKEEYRKEKELEEARKAGTEPAVTDVTTGRDINPHIPQFITAAPWYLDPKGATLNHQRPHEERQKNLAKITDWYKRGVTGKIATRFRKGACENCGAMTHKKRDCFERPRTIGARFTGEDMAPDEYMQPDLEMGYDAKRDRWNGYDPSEQRQVIEEFQKLEETRKMVKAERIKQGLSVEGTEGAEGTEKEGEEGETATPVAAESLDNLDSHEEDKYAESADMPGVKTDMDSRTRITVRNLRIREDTAKYLYNLDPNGPYYDPKARSMRDNPFQGVPGKEEEAARFSGENFIRYTGEVVDANKAQLFAWQAKHKGVDVHALAEPTKLEALQRELGGKTDDFKDKQKQQIYDRYGGSEHVENAPPKELLMGAQSEVYVEFNRKGQLLKGEERLTMKSMYEEDVYPSNHKSIWGSYWKDGQWGFNCCHSLIRQSYCLGEVGRTTNEQVLTTFDTAAFVANKEGEAAKKSTDTTVGKDAEQKDEQSAKQEDVTLETEKKKEETSSSSAASSDEEEKEEEKKRQDRLDRRRAAKRQKRLRRKETAKKRQQEEEGAKSKSKKKKQKDSDSAKGSSSSSSRDSSSAEDEQTNGGTHNKNKTGLSRALKEAAKEERLAEQQLRLGDRKRKYNSHYETKAPTEDQMEAYRLRQIHTDDPMAQFIEKKRKKD